jgi:hypothetical protein
MKKILAIVLMAMFVMAGCAGVTDTPPTAPSPMKYGPVSATHPTFDPSTLATDFPGPLTIGGVVSPDGALPKVLDAPELSDTASDPDFTLTAAEVSGNIITSSGIGEDATFTFPALSTIEGSSGIFIIEDAFQSDLIPNGTEQFYLNGVQMDAGEHIVNAADTAGDMISWICTETACYFKSENSNWAQATP